MSDGAASDTTTASRQHTKGQRAEVDEEDEEDERDWLHVKQAERRGRVG